LAGSIEGSIGKIETIAAWDKALYEIERWKVFALDLQTDGLDTPTANIRQAQIALPDGRIYLADMPGLSEKARQDLALLVEDGQVRKVIHNAALNLSFICAAGRRRLKFKNIFDIMLASQICWSGYYDLAPSPSARHPWKKRVPDHSLEALAERHLGILLSQRDYSAWAAERAGLLLPLYAVFQDLMERNGLQKIADLEFRTLSPVVEMQISGIFFDREAAVDLKAEKEIGMVRAFMDLQDEARQSGYHPLPEKEKPRYYINPDNREDVMSYLKSRGFQAASTRSDVLREIASQGCRFAGMLLEYRRLCHDLAFLENWLAHLHCPDNRIHSTYFQLKSATGRLSSCRPCAQQIPRRGEDAPAMRRLFAAPPGKKIVKADFSAIELRIMAYLSGDETMINALQEGQDLHKLTASKVGNLPLNEVTDVERQAAKTINFLLIYGGSAKTLQWRALSDYGAVMSLPEAEEARERFFQTYPGIRAWQERQIAENSYTHQHYFHNCVHGTFALPLTCTFTALGRRRVWPRFGLGIKASKFQLFNTPCQGTGADLIKLVMCEVYDRLASEDARMVGSIHDEILLEVPEEEAEEYAKMLCDIMSRVGSELLYPVVVKATAEISSSW